MILLENIYFSLEKNNKVFFEIIGFVADLYNDINVPKLTQVD